MNRLLMIFVLTACGSADLGIDAGTATDSAIADADMPPPELDASIPVVPMIDDVLDDCRVDSSGGGTGRNADLVRHDLDLAVFPDALCNDGTGALFFFRPYRGDANRD